MPIPAARLDLMCQILKDSCPKVKVYNNNTGADVSQGDFVVLDDKVCGVTDLDSTSGEDISVSVTEGMNILTSQTAALSTFDTQGTKVYWDATNKEFTDISATGLYLVGFIVDVKSGDQILFEKSRYVEEVVA